jgi:hypothetical protein
LKVNDKIVAMIPVEVTGSLLVIVSVVNGESVFPDSTNCGARVGGTNAVVDAMVSFPLQRPAMPPHMDATSQSLIGELQQIIVASSVISHDSNHS